MLCYLSSLLAGIINLYAGRKMDMERDSFSEFDIKGRVRVHDIHQFEIKFEYNLEELEKTNSYEIETFLFVPYELQINREYYSRADFYLDLKNYIRFKTPRYSFKTILDPDFTLSPLNVLKKLAGMAENAKTSMEAGREAKLLGVMVNARLKGVAAGIEKRLNTKGADSDSLEKYMLRKIEDVEKVLKKFRDVVQLYKNNRPNDGKTLEQFEIVEEFLSSIAEERLIEMIERAGSLDSFPEVRKKLTEFCDFENKLRNDNDYSLNFDGSSEQAENFIYRLKQYKKNVASVLYLDVERERKAGAFEQMIGAWAAFIAAIVSVSIVSLISKSFAQNSLPFILLFAAGYAFKDRIKDLIKLLLNPRVLSRFPDHITNISDSSDKKPVEVGSIREKVFFTEDTKLDPAVNNLRQGADPLDVLPVGNKENILVYQKEINLNTAVIREKYSRTVNLTDIIRLNLGRYFEKMDDPAQIVHYFNRDNCSVGKQETDRVYHLNMVVKYTKFRDKGRLLRYERYRIIMTKAGIKKVEFLQAG